MFKLRYLIILLYIICFTACIKEIEDDLSFKNGDWVEAAITITIPSTYDRMNVEMESYIKNVDVLAFRQSGNHYYYSFRSIGKNITGTVRGSTEFIATLRKDAYHYKFVILTNCREEINELEPMFSSSLNKEALLEMILSENNDAWNTSDIVNYQPIPMWGESEKLKIEENTRIDNVLLLRSLARIDVSLSASAQEDFQLKEVYLYNRSTKGNIIPARRTWDNEPLVSRITSPTIPETNSKIKEGLKYQSPSSTEFTRSLYTYEAEGVEYGKDSEATCLVVGGIFKKDEKNSYYRIDFKGSLEDLTGLSDNNHYDPILRNHLYDIVINSVSASGFETPDEAFENKWEGITVSIRTWDMMDVDSAIDGTYTLKVSIGALYLSSAGVTKKKITIESTYPSGWDIHIPDSWISAQKTDNKTLIVTVTPYSETRSGYIDVTAGNLTKRIKIQQN